MFVGDVRNSTCDTVNIIVLFYLVDIMFFFYVVKHTVIQESIPVGYVLAGGPCTMRSKLKKFELARGFGGSLETENLGGWDRSWGRIPAQ